LTAALSAVLTEPFGYQYMVRAMALGALIGTAAAALSCFLILKGWSLLGDALAHSVVPGVAIAALLALPYALGAFLSGLIAALAMVLVKERSRLRQDVAIGLVFTSFFALGLLIASINPIAVDIQAIVLGNILAIGDAEALQAAAIALATLIIIALVWRDLVLVFFDEPYARAIGVRVPLLRGLFFALASACAVAGLQSVGAVLVIAMLITPGATAYLLTDRFGRMLLIAAGFGALTSALGVYLSFFLDGATGGLIVLLQTGLFLLAFLFAPKHGRLAARRARIGHEEAAP
jgi:manganese/iron transport system permease protein